MLGIYGVSTVRKLGNVFQHDYHMVKPDDWTGTDTAGGATENTPYFDALKKIKDALSEQFPLKPTYRAITACVQSSTENVNGYFNRLIEVKSVNSGLSPEEGWLTEAGQQDTPSVWENLFCEKFLNGLNPDMKAGVSQSCIGLIFQPRAVKLLQHATHHENIKNEKNKVTKAKKDKQQEESELILNQQIKTPLQKYQQAQSEPKDVCYHCG